MFSAWVNHRIVYKMFKAFSNIKNSAVCTEFPMCSKFNFSQWETYFSEFFDKFFKRYWNISFIICYVWHVNSFNLCKCSTLKLRLGHKFSQFIQRFKIGIFWVLVLDYTSKCFPINKGILGFLNVVLAELLSFFPIHEIYEKMGFLNISLGCTFRFFPIH